MKHIYLLIIFVFSIATIAQNNKPDFNLLNSTTNELAILDKTNNSNKSTNLIQIIDSILLWQDHDAPWGFLGHPASRTTNLTYDANSNLISAESQIYNLTLLTYEKMFLFTYTYDLYNNQTSYLVQTWDNTLNVWVNHTQFSYSYDLNNNKLTHLEQNWIAGAWVNKDLFTITYNSNNHESTHLSQKWIAGAWQNLNYYNYTFNASNKPISNLYKSWNTATSAWRDVSKSTFTYDINDDITYTLAESWYSNTWNNGANYTYTYDINHNQLSVIAQSWNATFGWVNSSNNVKTYDASNNIIFYLNQYWNTSNSSWRRASTSSNNYDINNFKKNITNKHYDSSNDVNISAEDSTVYYYHSVVGLNELALKEKSISVYPNPSNGILNIRSSNIINSIELYNNLGVLVSKPEIMYNNQIDLSSLSKGMYFLKVSDGKQYHTEKVIIE
jgi:YD repeat-containing protein